jgi:arsenate reductase-like glutaredoxin family protein
LQNDIALVERDYFKEPFSEAEIRELARFAGVEQIFARRSPSLKQMGLAGKDLSEDDIVDLMLREPKLVRRPLIRVEDQVFVGAGASVLDSVVAAAT